MSSRFSKMDEVVRRAVKSARYPALLGKVCAFDKTDQNLTNGKARTFSSQKCGISRDFWVKYDQIYELWNVNVEDGGLTVKNFCTLVVQNRCYSYTNVNRKILQNIHVLN
jgi:hypothetical protein